MKQSKAVNLRKVKINVFTDVNYTLFLLFFYFFVFVDFLQDYVGFLSYFDELIAISALILFLINSCVSGNANIEKYSFCIVLFLAVGLISGAIFNYQPFISVAIPDAFINAKFWLSIYFGKCIFNNFNFKLYARKIYFHLRLIIILFIALTIADNLFDIFNVIPEYGFRSTHIFYSHPTHFTWKCVLLCTLLMCVRKYVKHADLFFVFCLILMASTLKIKALTTVFAFLIIYYYIIKKHRKINLLVVAFFFLIALIVGWKKIYFYFFSDIQNDSARYQLLITSFLISGDHFPLGAGFGTFASYMSGVNYSALYDIYKISDVWGLSPQYTAFINDSFWPMILGQTGVVGLLIFIMAVVFLYRRIKQIKKVDSELFGVAFMIFAAVLISSVIESAFVHPDSVPLAILLGLLLSKKKDKSAAKSFKNKII